MKWEGKRAEIRNERGENGEGMGKDGKEGNEQIGVMVEMCWVGCRVNGVKGKGGKWGNEVISVSR